MSYGPFLGGKRICLGKTFAENVGRSILSIVLSQVEFSFVNQEHYEKKPSANFYRTEIPQVQVKLSELNRSL